jgi:uncharacterized membrane protein (UPF0136 family)
LIIDYTIETGHSDESGAFSKMIFASMIRKHIHENISKGDTMKTMEVLFLFMFFMCIGLYGQTEPTDTDSDGKREVSTLDHLLWISQSSSRWSYDYEQVNDIDASATSGWNSGAGFSPIGNYTTKFTGSYDGQGFTIDSLFIKRTSDWTGLFGMLLGAEISNLGVTGVSISGAYGTGGLAGDNYTSSTIYNCYSTGSVSGTTYVGGLVGINQQASIANSYSSCTVSGSNTTVGGLIGDNNESTVSQCYATGSVSGINVVGGLIGYHRNATTVSNNYCRGSVVRISGSLTDFGSFCGYNSASIQYSYATGTVSCGGATNKGFVGFNSSGSYTSNYFDAEASGQESGFGATAKTTLEMKTQSTFTSWNFETIWEIVGGDGANYPRLQIIPDPALPVELNSFAATQNDCAVTLQWTTETELNNYGFEIEKRINDGLERMKDEVGIMKWNGIGFVEGNGTTNAPKEYSFTDNNPSAGTYLYRLKQIDRDGKFSYSPELEVTINNLPAIFALEQNYPNPFNPTTTIGFTLQQSGHTTLKVYDAIGREVAVLVNESLEAGVYHQSRFDARQFAGGVYFIRLTAADRSQIRKMVLLK